MARSARIADIGCWMLEHGHQAALKLTGGRWPRTIGGMATVELHTVGRRTGERRTTPLTAPILEPDRVVLVASRGGHPENPGWYKNLVAHPDVELTIGEATTPWRARTADPEEKARLWPDLVRANRAYAGYAKATERDIPVVVCEPRPA
jgi:deazaflavin-dependent oxidoreductase (nitroreductase family)